MPTISMFYGIRICIFYEKSTKHHLLHFHAFYNEFTCVVDVVNCEILEGNMPKKQERLILAWTELHRKELIKNIQIINNSGIPYKINPLV